jgi:hypothetical protein
MADAAGKERRKEERHEREGLSVMINRSGRPPAEFSTMDLSSKGLGLQADEELAPGEKFKFRIDLPQGPVFGSAVVRWISPFHLGFRCGAAIENVNWSGGRKLYYYLHPDKEDPVKILDRVLMTSFFVVAFLLALDFCGISLRSAAAGLARWILSR